MSAYGGLMMVRFRVVGTEGSGLLMNNPVGMATPKEKTVGHKVIPTPEQEAEVKCYRMPNGQLYLPAIHFRSSILCAASGMKIEKKAARQIIAAALFATNEYCALVEPGELKPIKQYEIDTRRAVVQRQGISRSRPRVPSWQTEIEFTYEPKLLRPDMIQQVFELAGLIVGVGDYRPAKNGPFGRYMVELIKN